MNTQSVRLITIAFGISLSLTPIWASAAKSKFNAVEWADAAKGKTIQFAVYKAEPHIVYTPASAVGGGLIDSMTRPDGSKIPLADTAYLLANQLQPQLSSLVEATWSKNEELLPLPAPKDKNIASYKTQYPADYILEMVVPTQVLSYKPTAWATYKLQISIESRLIDNSTGTILWKYKDRCVPTSSDGKFEIHNDEFAANDGQRLKTVLAAVVEECATLYLHDFKGEQPAKKKR